MIAKAALSIALLAGGGCAVVACQTQEPASPVVGLTSAVDPPQPPDLGRYPDRDLTIHLYLTENLRHVCSGPDPFFHFDSDRVTPQDQPGLYALAACLLTGPLKDSRIALIGRADPRGTPTLNDKLGLQRAESVKEFLVKQGVPTDRLVTVTRGKEDADPARSKWPTDRRVDIDLLP